METRSTVPHGATSGATAVADAPKTTATRGNQPAAAASDKPLTAAEKTALKSLEQTIDKGLKTFLEVGSALERIRDERLYRGTHSTFDGYCRERWGMSKTQANRFISAFDVSKNLAPIGVIPTSESQVRVLSSLPPDKQRKVFERAAKQAGGAEKVTASGITEAAQKLGFRQAAPPQSSTAPASPRPDGNFIARKEVIAALDEWAAEHWEKASTLTVADFSKAIHKLINNL